MEHTFPAATVQRIVISEIAGTLKVRGWDQQSIKIITAEQIANTQQEGDALIINGIVDNLELIVPYETSINASAIAKYVSIEQVRQVELQEVKGTVDIQHVNGNVSLYAISKHTVIDDVKGDVRAGNLAQSIAIQHVQGNLYLYDMHGDVDIHEVVGEVALGRIDGHLTVKQVPVLRGSDRIERDVLCSEIVLVELPIIDSNLILQNVQEALLGKIGDTLQVQGGFTKLHCARIGRNCHIAANGSAEVVLEHVGNDLFASRIAQLQVRHVGNHCQVQDSQEAIITIGHVGNSLDISAATHVQIGKVGSNCILRSIAGNLQIGFIGANLDLQDAQGNINMGKIGANAHIAADFPLDSVTRLYVGGSAEIVLPTDANLTLQAKVGGQVNARALSSRSLGNSVHLVYGDGAAHLELQVGGNLKLDGGANPKSSSSSASTWNWDGFSHEMADFGNEMGRLGQDLNTQINAAFNEATASINADFTRTFEKQKRKQQEQNNKTAERTRRAQERAQEKAARFNMHFNNREWPMDSEHLDRLLEQARNAAADGIEGALEAVEQALKNVNIIRPMEPMKPMKPMEPMKPMKPMEPMKPMKPFAPLPPLEPMEAFSASAQESIIPPSEDATQRVVEESSSPNLEQEREAILRMIAGGRITAEEGDMLLEALGD